MIVKVKHTKNGNVKITMSLAQADALRAALVYAGGPTGGFLTLWTQEVIAHIDQQLAAADIQVAF
jgi:hypothetical protein